MNLQSLCMALFTSMHVNSPIEHVPKVTVIGAGLAGLTAAYYLHKAGIEVEVYEARKRVGGRIHSVYLDGNTVELGGQNITDGGKNRHFINLMDELGLESVSSLQALNGHCINNKTCISIKELIQKRGWKAESLKKRLFNTAQKAHTMQDVIDDMFDADDPLYTVSRVRLAAYEGGLPENLSTVYTDTLYHVLLGSISAVHNDTNYIEHSNIKGGNSLLPARLSRALGTRVHLGMPLKVVQKDANGTYKLTFENGFETSAHILVLAIPCSVYESIDFQETVFPKEKLASIKQIRYGQNAKIIVPLTDAAKERRYFLTDYMISFLNKDNNILTLYYVGNSSHFSATSVKALYQKSIEDLKVAFPVKMFPTLTPVLATDEAFGCYKGPVGYSWPNDTYARGSYAYISPGQESLLKAVHEEEGYPVKTLFGSIDQTLYFAGEHTSNLFDVPGTMEAACQSGKSVADIIGKRLSIKI